jgi:hypothetical protein
MSKTDATEWVPEPSKYRRALNLYSKLMDEAKLRLEAMETALAGKTGLPNGAVREFCFLQLRLLCEVIALASLAAHGDIEVVHKLRKTYRKTYEADKIIRELKKLHPKFYPHAAIQTKQGPEEFIAVLRKDGFLTKEELIQVYGRCGNVLHRGSFRGLFLTNRYANLGFAEIKAWKDKIEALLGYHLISMVDNKTFVLFTLRNKLNNNQVQWMSFEKIEDQTWTWEPGVEIRIPASYWPQQHWVGE